jgi:drug/metabolite transporter (DMT)-like permease
MSPNQRGILLMTLGMGGFAVEDAFIKAAAERLVPGQILLTLGIAGAVVFAVAARRRGRRVWSREALHWAVMGRNASEMIGSAAYVLALALVPLTLVTAIFQAIPLAVTMGAALFLGEAVGWRRWGAILVGFAGVLIIIRPGAADFDPASLLALVSVVGLGARDLFTRRIPRDVDTTQLTAWGFVAVALIGAAQLLLTGGAVVPRGPEWWILGGALGAGVAAYWWLTEATRVGELSAVMPFRYTRLLFALVIGALVFGERPDAWTITGSALVVASGIYAFLRERARARAALRVALSAASPPR